MRPYDGGDLRSIAQWGLLGGILFGGQRQQGELPDDATCPECGESTDEVGPMSYHCRNLDYGAVVFWREGT